MSTTVGTLTIEMAANIVRLQQDMDKARSTVENTMAKISKAAGAAGVAMGALGIAAGAGAFASWIKNAIDAADETNKLAQKIGTAVPQVAGLQLAFRQSGIDAGALQTSMSKLSVAIANGNDAFVAMNISTKNSDGTLKNTRQILGEVADKFKAYEDGAAKTALAVQLFGKSGAELIPLLNGGSEALDEFDAMAKKLGLTLDENTAKRAEKFNDTLDLMGQGFKGISMNIAAQLLPTLEGLADQFFSAMTEGDRLKKIGDALAMGLKGLYIVGIALVGAFEAVGDTLYAMGKQAMAIMQGDFAGAVKAGNRWSNEMKANWTGSLDAINKAWNANGSTAISTMTAVTAAAKKQAPYLSDATKKQTDALAKQEEAYQKLLGSIDEKIAVVEAEIAQGKKLSPAQQLEIKLLADINAGTVKLNAAQLENVKTRIRALKAVEDLNDELKLEKKILEESAKVNEKWFETMDKSTQGLIQEAEKQREANETFGMGKEAIEELRIAKLREMAVSADKKAQWAEEAMLGEEVTNAYRDQAKALRDLANLKEEGIHLQSAKDAAEAWAKATDSITNDLSDALMRGFENGKGFVDNMVDYLKNKFKSTVAEFVLKPIIGSAVSTVASSLGISAGTSAATGSLMFNGATLAAQGSAFAQGFTSTVSGWFSGGAPVSSLGSATSGAFNIGASAASAVPYVTAALVALNALGFMKSDRKVGGGLQGTLGEGNITSYDLRREGGTLFNGPSYYVANKQISELSAYLQGSFFKMRDSAAVMAQVIGKSTDEVSAFTMALGDIKVHPDIAELGLALEGLTEEQKGAKIKEVFDAANEAMAKLVLGTTDLQHAGESAYEALQRLAGIQLVSNALNEFGGAFSNFATASVNARESVINLSGGIEQLMNKAQGFVSNFYTPEEQAAITARGVVTALGIAGFTEAQIASLQTRADFRSLLESIDLSAENGAQQFAALLDLQDEFANLSGTMTDNNQSLIELIEAAPQVEMLQKIFESDAEYQTRVQTAEERAQVAYDAMVTSLGSLNVSMDNLSTIVFNAMEKISNSTAAALSQANAATAMAIAAAQASAAEQAAADAATAAQTTTYGTYTGGYASGGFMTGPALVGEHGPELFDPRTNQVYTAPATSNIFGGNELVAEMRALRDEVSMMRYETKSTATNTAKIARLQDNWDVRGLTVKTDADQPLDTVVV